MSVPAAGAAGAAVSRRVVACVDQDYFYAQVAVRARPDLDDSAPVAVRQKYIVVTCNYAARRRGVGKLMALTAALQVCPELVVVDGSDLRPFREASDKIYALLCEFGAPVERLGLDECFIDLTALVDLRLQGNTTATATEAATGRATSKEAEVGAHVVGCPDACEAITVARLHAGSRIVASMRGRIRTELGLTCCGGVSVSKLGAKLACEMHKPNEQTLLLPSSVAATVGDLPVRGLQGVGRKAAAAAFSAYLRCFPGTRVTNAKELLCKKAARIPARALAADLRDNKTDDSSKSSAAASAQRLLQLFRGEDDAPVVHSGATKTISVEETSLPHPSDWAAAAARLAGLCDRLRHMLLERRRTVGDSVSTLRVTVTDKGEAEAGRKARVSRSKQCRVDAGAVLADADCLFRVSAPLLRAVLKRSAGAPFCLCRMNLAATDFAGSATAASSGSVKKGAAASSSPAPIAACFARSRQRGQHDPLGELGAAAVPSSGSRTASKRRRTTSSAGGPAAPRQPTISSMLQAAAAKAKPKTFFCPLCSKEVASSTNAELNAHIDSCLK